MMNAVHNKMELETTKRNFYIYKISMEYGLLEATIYERNLWNFRISTMYNLESEFIFALWLNKSQLIKKSPATFWCGWLLCWLCMMDCMKLYDMKIDLRRTLIYLFVYRYLIKPDLHILPRISNKLLLICFCT